MVNSLDKLFVLNYDIMSVTFVMTIHKVFTNIKKSYIKIIDNIKNIKLNNYYIKITCDKIKPTPQC